MKKLLSLLLTIMILPLSAEAEIVEIDGIYYELVTKIKETKVTSNPNKYTGAVVIPASVTYNGAEYSVTSIGFGAFKLCRDLTSVTIPNSVTSIESEAFQACYGLTSVTIGNKVTSIGSEAFAYCNNLTSVHINDVAAWCKISFGNSLSNPLYYAHYLYLVENEIKDLVIPNSVTSIGNYAFQNSSGLTSVTIPNSVTSIGSYAFAYCSGLTSATIPNSVSSIGDYAFRNCSGLTSVTIPNSVSKIESATFFACRSLTSLTIGSGVKYIYSQAFASCEELTDVYCLAKAVPSTFTDAFKDSYIEYATLHVSDASVDTYKAVEPWKCFRSIVSLTGEDNPEDPEVKKCATPTIAFANGELVFSCETEGVEYVSEVRSPETKKYYDSKVMIGGLYKVSVYATKEGWENSDTATLEFTLSGGEGLDANKDGKIDVADILTFIGKIAGS